MILTQAISRVIFSVAPHRKTLVFLRATVCVVLAAVFASPQLALATIIRMETTLGAIDILLYDNDAPITVANFLSYASRGYYTNNGFIHRSAPGFVVQGGGYAYGVIPITGQPFFFHIPEDLPIQNEFSPSRSNIRGTIAMAKIDPSDPGGGPDSATSEWFFNLADNSATLDNTANNGGFTVFGSVIAGMNVVDDIANDIQPSYLPMSNGSTQLFSELPVIDSSIGLQLSNFVRVTSILKVASTITNLGTLEIFTTDLDMAFDYVRTVATDTVRTWLTSFTSPPNQSVHFNNGMFTLKLIGPMGTVGRVVTLYDGATNRPTHYYAYGKTPDNQTDHWYDFSYDGETGAEIKSDRIVLHFVDGERGDDDLKVNDSITHTGAQAVVTENANSSSQAGGGCSIATTPSRTPRGGDWIVVSLFLAFVAIVRRRTHHNRIQRAPRWRNSDLEPSPLMEEGGGVKT